jgi:hypothetical protein
MPWTLERERQTLHIHIAAPMRGEWESLMDAVHASLDPRPLAIYLPARIPSSSKVDADMLRVLWQALGDLGIPLLPPK